MLRLFNNNQFQIVTRKFSSHHRQEQLGLAVATNFSTCAHQSSSSSDARTTPEMSTTSSIMSPTQGPKTASGITRTEAAKQRAELAKAAVEFGIKHDMITTPKSAKSSYGGVNNNNNAGGENVKSQQQQQSKDSLVVETQNANSSLAESRAQYEQKKSHSFKVKRKAPWGAQQLRDAWSEDAMSRHDKDSVGERIDREYRYHPEAYLRKIIKWVGLAIPPAIVLAFSVGYYWASGYSVYKVGDFQAILNILRQFDTSPRSALFLPKTADNLSTPFELTDGEGPRRRRVGAREEYDALVAQYRLAKAESESSEGKYGTYENPSRKSSLFAE